MIAIMIAIIGILQIVSFLYLKRDNTTKILQTMAIQLNVE